MQPSDRDDCPVRGVLHWRLEYEADEQAAVSTARGVGTDAAGNEVARAEVRVRLRDAAALGSAPTAFRSMASSPRCSARARPSSKTTTRSCSR